MPCLFFMLNSCVILHRVQIGEIDNRSKWNKRKFEVIVTELGVNVKSIGKISKRITKKRRGEKLANIISLFQMGPRTGHPVYNQAYARSIYNKINRKCPSGRVTGLESVRETRSYEVVSGEGIRITGYCLTPRK